MIVNIYFIAYDINAERKKCQLCMQLMRTMFETEQKKSAFSQSKQRWNFCYVASVRCMLLCGMLIVFELLSRTTCHSTTSDGIVLSCIFCSFVTTHTKKEAQPLESCSVSKLKWMCCSDDKLKLARLQCAHLFQVFVAWPLSYLMDTTQKKTRQKKKSPISVAVEWRVRAR